MDPLTALPRELLHDIVSQVYACPPAGTTPVARQNQFARGAAAAGPLLRLHTARLLYRYVAFPRPQTFHLFLRLLKENAALGPKVEVMDFSEFTLVGLGRTGRMNQEIQMVTLATLLNALQLTPNLREFLALELIEHDMDHALVSHLFNAQPKLQAVDFCGATSDLLDKGFGQLVVQQPLPALQRVLFHDCTTLEAGSIAKVIHAAPNLERLDLTHTQMTAKALTTSLPATSRLTHLLLARCSRLTTNDLMEFMSYHPLIRAGLLQWLNLSVDSNVVAPLTNPQLHRVLKLLALFGANLLYLNLAGLPVNDETLKLLRKHFPQLELVGLLHARDLTPELVARFMEDLRIRAIAVTGVPGVTRGVISHWLDQQPHRFPLLEAVEYTPGVLAQMAVDKNQTLVVNLSVGWTLPPVLTTWRFVDYEGQRGWLYRLAEGESAIDTGDLVYYDLATGKKMVKSVAPPNFPKWVLRKVVCSRGPFAVRHDVWGGADCERGIYRHYGMKVK